MQHHFWKEQNRPLHVWWPVPKPKIKHTLSTNISRSVFDNELIESICWRRCLLDGRIWTEHASIKRQLLQQGLTKRERGRDRMGLLGWHSQLATCLGGTSHERTEKVSSQLNARLPLHIRARWYQSSMNKVELEDLANTYFMQNSKFKIQCICAFRYHLFISRYGGCTRCLDIMFLRSSLWSNDSEGLGHSLLVESDKRTDFGRLRAISAVLMTDCW